MEAGPKKSRIVSQEFINTTDEETEAESRPVSKPKSISTTDEESEAESRPVSKPKSKTEVYVDIATKPPSQFRPQADKMAKPKSKPRPWAQSRQPKLESGSRLKSPPVQKKVSPTTQKRRDEQNAAIQRGEFQLADSPCDTCKRRLNRHIVACAKMAKDDNATCLTCKLGKMNCSFVKVMDGQVKIVQKVKKPQEKQDVTMADVSEG